MANQYVILDGCLLAARAPLREAPEYPIKYSLERGHTDLKF